MSLTRALPLILSLLFTFTLWACGASDSNDEPSPSDLEESFFCSSSNPCPSGMFCFNGLCAIGCTSNENCADDQYCDGLYCVNTEVPTCTSDSNCYEGQICVQGVCSTPPPSTTCDPDQVVSGNDGCDNYSLCIDGDDDGPEDPACYTMPPCAEDGTCPVGAYGAVCNNEYINKARICLIGACESEANCPSGNVCCKIGNAPIGGCVPEGQADLLGCGSGGFPGGGGGSGGGGDECFSEGDFCDSDEECCDGLICEGADLGLGICVQ